MAILTSTDFSTATGVSPTGADLAALQAICKAVSDAIVRMAGGNVFERATYTSVVLDAPWNDRVLRLPQWPVASVSSLYLNWNAKGDPSLFDSTHLLTNFTDYRLLIDDHVLNVSRRGKVEILTRPYWAYQHERTLAMPLTGRLRNCPGCVKATFVAGYSVLPDDLVQAAVMAATLMYQRRKRGAPVNSESLNSYSYSLSGEFTAAAALQTPDAWLLLRPYVNQLVIA